MACAPAMLNTSQSAPSGLVSPLLPFCLLGMSFHYHKA